MIENLFAELRRLLGLWRGEGRGKFPTIDSFRYLEETRYTENEGEMLVHFEQKSWQLNEAGDIVKPLHWESGFFIPTKDGFIDILNAQNSGRVEVLRGRSERRKDVWILDTKSVLLGHDARMVSSARRFEVKADTMRCEVQMATSRVGKIQIHLEAELNRV